MKQTPQGVNSDLVSLSVRVKPETARRLKKAADAEFRPVAAELRRMIEERVADVELDEAA